MEPELSIHFLCSSAWYVPHHYIWSSDEENTDPSPLGVKVCGHLFYESKRETLMQVKHPSVLRHQIVGESPFFKSFQADSCLRDGPETLPLL